jgi:hypothetical protein
LLVGALLGLGGLCCGGKTDRPATTTTTTTASAKAAPAPRDADSDRDSTAQAIYDSDDTPMVHFGRLAGFAQENAIASVLERYYAAAAAGNGVAACPLIYSLAVEDYAEEQNRLPGPSGVAPGVCARVVSGFFRRLHRSFAPQSRGLHLVSVEIDGQRALAVFRLGTQALRRLVLKREGGAWKLATLVDLGVP